MASLIWKGLSEEVEGFSDFIASLMRFTDKGDKQPTTGPTTKQQQERQESLRNDGQQRGLLMTSPNVESRTGLKWS